MNLYLDLIIIFSIFFWAICVNVISGSSTSKPISDKCTFPRLRERLSRMIAFGEPAAFDFILHSECRGRIDLLNPLYMDIFNQLLGMTDVGPFIKAMMRDETYTPAMLSSLQFHRPLLSLGHLEIFKLYAKQLDISVIYSVSLEYPVGGAEREFLIQWLVELQQPALKWPFTRSLPSKPQSRIDSHHSEGEDTKSSAIPTLNFGHIYGWVSRKSNPIVRNSNQPFNFRGHSVALRDNFLGFASSKFNLQEFADASGNANSFFVKHNAALSQRIRSSTRNFAACRLVPSGMQAILKGDLNLVVLEALPDGRYDFKYPENPYRDLIIAHPSLKTVSLLINPTDIVLFLPRSLFIQSAEISISPHDIPGAFHYTELKSFATSFVNFINFVHLKTKHHGLIAVGGFVHHSDRIKKKSKSGDGVKIR